MKKIFVYTASALVLTACGSEAPIANEDSDVATTITARIGESNTRVSDNLWTDGDKIGISTEGNDNEDYTNVEYTVSDKQIGSFTGDPIYFRNRTSDVTFRAYYPFTVSSDITDGVISGNTATAAKDYLWASTTGSKANPSITFNFAHKMSQVTLTFVDGNGSSAAKISGYTIRGLKQEGTFNTNDGTAQAIATASAADRIVSQLSVVSNSHVNPVIFYPQDAAEGSVTLEVMLEGSRYVCNLPFKDNKLASGNNYLFTVKVNKSGISVAGSTIEGWTDVVNESGEISAEL